MTGGRQQWRPSMGQVLLNHLQHRVKPGEETLLSELLVVCHVTTEVLLTSYWNCPSEQTVIQSRFSPSLSPSLHFPISVQFALCCHSYCYFVHSFYLPSIDPPFRYVFFLSTLCVVLCAVCVHRVSCVFLCTSWRSEGSLRWLGLWMPCWTWPPPDTPSPRRQPLPGPVATSRQCSCRCTCSVGLVWKWC